MDARDLRLMVEAVKLRLTALDQGHASGSGMVIIAAKQARTEGKDVREWIAQCDHGVHLFMRAPEPVQRAVIERAEMETGASFSKEPMPLLHEVVAEEEMNKMMIAFTWKGKPCVC